MSDQNSWQTQRQALEAAFLQQLPATLAELEAAWQQLQPGGWDTEVIQQIERLAHKLAGSAAGLGYTGLGETARTVERFIKERLAQPAQAGQPAQDLPRLGEHIHALRLALLAPQREAGERECLADTSLKITPSLQENRSAQLIYLVEDDPLQANEVAAQVSYFGYTVRIFSRLDDMNAALQSEIPAAILMDIVFPEGKSAGIEAISALGKTFPAPVIFISVREDLPARLQVVRAGGIAYFTKPLNTARLIDVLDQLTIREDPIPYRVLIVDDALVQANYNAMHLRKAGMEVEVVTDPMQLLLPLSEFHPDLILLDMYMPDCTGMELATVLRQMDAFVSIPIVYLSAETDREKQLEAVGLGGDDFLTKPIKPAHLVASVTSRVERYRKLRSLMLRDSLTGLFNHTKTRECLAQEVSRAARLGQPMAYAMLDLDHFKLVNDTYGHAAGDRVLRSLAQLLSRRLRSSDVVGRYGGEEFAIIFPNTSGQAAAGLMDELRVAFAKIRHRTGQAEFTATFSCGVAAYPDCATPAGLSEAADRALYAAKRQGRNQVALPVARQGIARRD